jgi:hypothetical protein
MFLLCVAVAVIMLTGCPNTPQSEKQADKNLHKSPRPSVTLQVVVVNAPEVAEAIRRLRGEWAERFGGELLISPATWGEVIDQATLETDLIAFPSRYLGELCVRDWLRPVRSNVLESDDLRASDYFPVVRQELIYWGDEAMALPLGIGRAGIDTGFAPRPALALLARAALRATSNERLGVLFDVETMRPRIAEKEFVDALANMTRSNSDPAADQPGDADAVPVLGYSDLLLAVTASTRNAATAFKLLEWLALPDTSVQVARAGTDMLPVRRPSASSLAWYPPDLAAGERAEFAKSLDESLTRWQGLMLPRIPGIDEYLAALDEAARAAVTGGALPRDALEKASLRWEEITEARGRDAQRTAYLKHLGIADP